MLAEKEQQMEDREEENQRLLADLGKMYPHRQDNRDDNNND